MKRFFVIFSVLCCLSFVFVVPHVRTVNEDNKTEETKTLKDTYGKQLQAFAGKKGADLGAPRDVRVIIAQGIRVFLSIVALLAVIYIIYGGYLFLTSGGKSDKADKGRGIITNGIIGLLIIITSYSIVYGIYYTVYGAINPFGGYVKNDLGGYYQKYVEPDNKSFYNTDPMGGTNIPDAYLPK
ncbi:MAG: hypothetical protein COU81_02620 [Candidatus Portnoybacteria bacterium CG10_big_fil_rev_8_21_14_0_10_36_7]|uniref:DUF4190 domain-containing protein n=1 Tax=Candidatus Portnoybacteria bacterium CG10_big_fil_rev_8_21_14_0_10_36_7 TaxID=1974812 RepID=A0A2M8KDT9_9BACT|nr:MAG: hypothetical protein COU81_02620 [Candidatus Portnoybacteria bacterium CG10_big_fil_rev_8_21_14_0_10_36_7]